MRTGTVSYRLEDLKNRVIIPIGFVGENDFTRVIFDAEEIYKKYPNASVSMKVQPPKGGIYPATVTRDGNTVIWQVKEADVANRGGGELQLTFIDGETKIKTYIAKTDVKRSLAGNGPAPDPVQDWIDDANATLAEVEQALEDIPESIDAALEEAKESGEFDGPPGPSGEDGKDGRDGVDGKDGKDGQDGAPGQDGKDGKDGQDGAPGRDGTDGTDGQDGTDAYVWIRYAAAQPTADADMKTSPDAWIGIYSGDAATAPEHYTEYTWYKIKGEPGAVQDVQINGTTILGADGVANIPTANANDYGAIKIAGPAGVKEGTNGVQAIVAARADAAVFYGLTKAAGVDMKNSSNPVGTFTAEAKRAIYAMLGITPDEGELIKTVTAAEDLTEVRIDTDEYGEPFELAKMVVIIDAPPSTTGARDAFYVQIGYKEQDNTNGNTSAPSITYPSATSTLYAKQEITAHKGMPIQAICVAGSSEGNSQNLTAMPKRVIAKHFTYYRIYQSGATKSLIPQGSVITLYGIRA